jgi:hypothetical protein
MVLGDRKVNKKNKMSETIKDFKIPYPTEGVIRSAQLDDNVCPENSVQLAINMNFDRIGTISSRPGVATYATAQAGSIGSFGTLNSQSSSTKYLFARIGTTIMALNSTTGAWASVRTGLTGTGKARFSQFLNRTWMVNGNGGDAPKTSNGGTFDTTDVPGTFPKADFIQAGFDGRVWIADAAKDILYYTDIVQSTNGTSYVSPLTFDITANFISTFSPQDGESITGLFRVPKALLVFKQNHIYRVYSADNVDPYPAYGVGTFSQESIIQGKDGVYFHHSSGFYKFNYDGQPTEISRRVIDFIKAIPRANYASIVGVYDGYDAVKWSIGAVTVDGVTYSNCQMRYSISTQVWTIYDFASISITALIRYDNGTTIEQIAGISDGQVGKLDSGFTDFGAKIYYEVIDRERAFTEMTSSSKNITGIAVIAENGGGAEFQYQCNDSSSNEWEYLGTIKDKMVTLIPNTQTKDFNEVTLRLRGYSSGEPIIFKGIELLTVQDKGQDVN